MIVRVVVATVTMSIVTTVIMMIVRVAVVPIVTIATTTVMTVVPTVVAAVAAVMTAIRVTPPTRTTTSTAPIAKSVPNARVAAFVATSIPSRTDGKG